MILSHHSIVCGTALGLGCGLLFAACDMPELPPMAVYPLFTDSTLVDAPEIEGTWEISSATGSADDIWRFERMDSTEFRFTSTARDTSEGGYRARLVRLGDYLYLDLFSTAEDLRNVEVLSIPVHLFCRIAIAGDTLRMSWIPTSSWQRALGAGEVSLPHLELNSTGDNPSLLLTASTSELEQFVTQGYRTLAFATERSTTYPYVGVTFVRMVPEEESSSP